MFVACFRKELQREMVDLLSGAFDIPRAPSVVHDPTQLSRREPYLLSRLLVCEAFAPRGRYPGGMSGGKMPIDSFLCVLLRVGCREWRSTAGKHHSWRGVWTQILLVYEVDYRDRINSGQGHRYRPSREMLYSHKNIFLPCGVRGRGPATSMEIVSNRPLTGARRPRLPSPVPSGCRF